LIYLQDNSIYMNENVPLNKENTPLKKERIRETWLLRGRLTKGILVLTASLIVLFMTWLVFVYSKSTADQQIFDAISPVITPTLTRFMRFITYLGNPQFLVPVNLLLVIFLLFRKKEWLALRLAVVSLGGLGVKLLLKNLFQRARPIDPVIEGGVSGYSFPSGHALLGVVFYGFLIWWAAISIRNKWLQGFIIGILLLIILSVSFSRIYLRVHYSTDIMAGLCLGFVWLIFAFWQIDRIEIRMLEKGKIK
jgi:membrane-associated phospholipid phosphatase